MPAYFTTFDTTLRTTVHASELSAIGSALEAAQQATVDPAHFAA